MPQCELCRTTAITENKGNPNCAFENNVFSKDNWNCVTVSRIRKLINGLDSIKLRGIDFTKCITEQHYATINLDYIDELQDPDSDQPICLWVGWYKNRGRTEGMWLMFESKPPRAPTLEECLLIINYYETLIANLNYKGVNNGMA